MKAIYGILNKLNGKQYVGSSINFYKRKRNHLSKLRRNEHHSIHLQSSFNKHGEEMFEFIVLERIEEKEQLISREQWWIDNSNSEYNICKIAGNNFGVIKSQETRDKISKANKGKPSPMKGKKHSEETLKKISENRKGIFHTEETKKKISAAFKGPNGINSGKTLTDQCKIKKSMAMREYFKNNPPLRGRKCGKYDLNGNLIEIFTSIAEMARNEKIHSSAMSRYVSGKRNQLKKNKEYEYKYIDEIK